MDKHIDIVFFERPLVDLKRYALKIAVELKKINRSIRLASISLEVPPDIEATALDFCFLRKDIKHIDRFLKEHNVKMIVFSNPRIPDMEMILHAHHNNIKTIMIQEGVIFEGANINDVSLSNLISALSFIPKTVSYFSILRRMCDYDKKRYFGLLKEILTKKRNITSIVAHFFSPSLIGDYVFTMGEHWKTYYTQTMKYPEERVKIMGDHDLDGFKIRQSGEAVICYIATVLVEDGSRSRGEFEKFLSAMAKCIDKKTPLYIKLHPRSQKELYSILEDHNVTFVREGELPSTNIYIGHRSTLLARALYESDQLIIWKFPNEKEDFFEQFASHVCMSEDELRDAISASNLNLRTNEKRNQLERVYWLNPQGSICSAASMIYQYLEQGAINQGGKEVLL